MSYKLFSDLLTDNWSLGSQPSPGKSGVEIVAVESGRGGEEECNVEEEEGEDWEVEVQTQGSVLQETLGGPHCR